MSTAIGVSLPRLATAVGKAVSEYAVLGKTPGFTADFIKNRYPGYTSLSSAITHVRSGNATMTDGYGPELVVNGGFDSGDLTGFTDSSTGSGSVAVVDNQLQLISAGASNRGFVTSDSFSTKVGTAYLIEFNFLDRGGSSRLQFKFADAGGALLDEFPIDSTGRKSFVVVAERSSSYISINNYDTGTATIDSVSVREMPVIKWAPHNLLSYSEEFSQSVWNKANATVSGQEVTVTTASATNVLYQILSTVAGQYRLEAEVKAGTTDALGLKLTDQGTASHTVTVDLTAETISAGTGTTTDRSIEDIGDGWYLIGFNANIPAAGTDTVYFTEGATAFGSGDTFFVRNVRLFRSDLGGMVDNPDQPPSRASYVPTTSSAKYLPRIGHHVYNGSAWVNEGLLAESEARTNINTYSTDLANTTWKTVEITQSAGSTGPDGTADNTRKLVASVASNQHIFYKQVADSNMAASNQYTVSVYAKAAGYDFLSISLGQSVAGAVFDLANGVVDQVQYTPDSTTIQDVGNGWYRCSVTGNANASSQELFGVVSQSGASLNIYSAEVFSGNGTSGIEIAFPQTELGATPSSYIPTVDTATVTRASESFTIPSANLPWPNPVYVGSELTTNGTFDTDTSNWTAFLGTLSVVNSTLRVTADSAYGYAYQGFTTVIGNVYQVKATLVDAGTTVANFIQVGTNASPSSIINQNIGTTTGEYSFEFVATDTTTLVRVASGNGAGLYADWDNISVREINPLSLSIATEGRVSYADDGTNFQASMVNWGGATGYIRHQLRTDGANTGQIRVWQNDSAGTSDTAESDGDAYEEGILRSFNMAGRHGSTFINGALSGVTFTENTTPTELYDLSATDLELAYVYMGTIGTFRVWDRDITDDGLVEATNPSLEPSLSLTFEGTGTNSFVVNDWSE
jgi:hypothetical protein